MAMEASGNHTFVTLNNLLKGQGPEKIPGYGPVGTFFKEGTIRHQFKLPFVFTMLCWDVGSKKEIGISKLKLLPNIVNAIIWGYRVV